MTDGMLRVGRLAELTGLTVRTLHHYDELGLIQPSHRTSAGHRLYDDADVERLYRVIALRHLGSPLDRIAEVLADTSSLESTLRAHDRLLAEQISTLQSVRARIGASLSGARATSSSDLLDVIREVTTMDEMMARYSDADQMGELARRQETVGDDRIAQVENRWPSLMAEVDAAMAEGVDPRHRGRSRSRSSGWACWSSSTATTRDSRSRSTRSRTTTPRSRPTTPRSRCSRDRRRNE